MMRAPGASAMALRMAGAVGIMAHSPRPLATKGPLGFGKVTKGLFRQSSDSGVIRAQSH